MPLKLEERSWRQLAVKLASIIVKAQQGQVDPAQIALYVQAIQHKQNIDDGYYIEDGRTTSANDASSQA